MKEQLEEGESIINNIFKIKQMFAHILHIAGSKGEKNNKM